VEPDMTFLPDPLYMRHARGRKRDRTSSAVEAGLSPYHGSVKGPAQLDD
jgi:hypothetical protein